MSKVISIEGRTLAYQETGVGETVVLLHSGGFSSRQWKRLAQALSPSYRVINPDLLGYGASSPWPVGAPFHFETDLAALEALVAATGMGGVHWVGHSYGAFLALKLAAKMPTLARSLALFEPVSFGVLGDDLQAEDELGSMRTTYEVDPSTGADDLWLQGFVDWWNGPGAWEGLNAETKAAFRVVGWKVFEEVRTLVADRTPAAAYAPVAAPTLLLGGERSRPVERRVIERLAQVMPSATLKVFEGVGHMGPITHAPLVNAAIVEHVGAASAKR